MKKCSDLKKVGQQTTLTAGLDATVEARNKVFKD